MPKNKRRRKPAWLLAIPLVLAGIAFAAWSWFKSELQPMPSGPAYLKRYPRQEAFDKVLQDLFEKGVVRDVKVLKLYAKWRHEASPVPEGTYQFKPGMTVDEVFKALHSKIVQMVRIPETNFSYRTANLLEEHNVADARDYRMQIKDPAAFKDEVSFALPKESLEGYLFPDTYDLPPLLGAHDTISRQLRAFESKVYPMLKGVKDVKKVLTIASMVEMEAAKDKDRPLIAGVITNRLNLGMDLQIDATVLYGLQQWRRLTFADYKAPSAYNTYLHSGLPPGPICSPSIKSVEAALHPAKNDYLYYVALPTGYHMFAHTYAEHLANIAKRRAALAKGA